MIKTNSIKMYLVLAISLFIFIIAFTACANENSKQVESLKETKDKKETTEEISNNKPVNEKEIITLINKWHVDLYSSPNLGALSELLNVCIDDPEIKNITETIKKDGVSTDIISEISQWAEKNIAHTQALEIFKNEPGKDPWGSVGSVPTYKKLTPSEMKAMEVYTGKYTGKCGSIARFVLSLLRNNGLKKENYFMLRMKGHLICLFKYNGEYYVIDNNKIFKLNDNKKEKLFSMDIYGFYHEQYAHNGVLIINDEIFKSDVSFVDQLISVNKLDKNQIYNYENNIEKQKYIEQSLDVQEPRLYLKASLLGPRVIELSKELKDEANIINWIKENIGDNEVLKTDNSIMTADQTIVFKNGSNKDKGLLMVTLLTLKGNNPDLIISDEDVYVMNNEKIYSMSNLNKVERIKGEKKIIIKGESLEDN